MWCVSLRPICLSAHLPSLELLRKQVSTSVLLECRHRRLICVVSTDTGPTHMGALCAHCALLHFHCVQQCTFVGRTVLVRRRDRIPVLHRSVVTSSASPSVHSHNVYLTRRLVWTTPESDLGTIARLEHPLSLRMSQSTGRAKHVPAHSHTKLISIHSCDALMCPHFALHPFGVLLARENGTATTSDIE